MRTRFLLIFLLLSTLCASAKGRKEPFTAREAFETMPSQVRSYLTEQNTTELLIYYDEGAESPVTNDFDSPSRITELTPTKVTFVQGDDITTTIFVLNPMSDYPVIGVIETLSTPLPDSSVHFYTHYWQPADNIVAAKPGIRQWLTKQGARHMDDIAREIPFIIASCDYDPDTRTLTFTSAMDEYFRLDRPESLQYIKPAVKYKWTGTKFKPAN